MHEAARGLLGNQSCCQVTGRISASARKYWVFSCSQTTTHRNFACESFWMRSCNSNLKSCIDFNEFDVTMAREKWKKSHSKILKPFKEALRPRDHCPSLFFIEVKERRGVEQPLDLCTTHHSVLRHIPRRNHQKIKTKTSKVAPDNQEAISHHQPFWAIISDPYLRPSQPQPGIPTQVTPLVDRGELKRQQSQILRLSMSQGAQANSAIHVILQSCSHCSWVTSPSHRFARWPSRMQTFKHVHRIGAFKHWRKTLRLFPFGAPLSDPRGSAKQPWSAGGTYHLTTNDAGAKVYSLTRFVL